MTNRLLLAGDEEGFQLVAPTAADRYAAVVALEVDSQFDSLDGENVNDHASSIMAP